MDPTWFAGLERAHGHLAVLGLAVLVHPVLSLGRGRGLRRGTWWTALLGLGLLAPAFVLGLGLYPTWRTAVKPGLVQQALPVALAFEVKEHLAWLALVSGLGGLGVLGAAGGLEEARRCARWLLGVAVACGVVVAALGMWIAGATWPAW